MRDKKAARVAPGGLFYGNIIAASAPSGKSPGAASVQ